MRLFRSSSISTPLLIIVLLLTACLQTANPTPSTPEEHCGFEPEEESTTNNPDLIALEIWAPAPRENCWRAFGPVKAARRVTDFKIIATAKPLPMTYAQYREHFQQAATDSAAPDIAYAGGGELATWAEAGYIVPLDECRQKYTTFDDVLDGLWSEYAWQGSVWGIPVEVNLAVLYFNKALLRQLGWTPDDIAALPQKIISGTFTLDDILVVSQQAIEAGIVQPGFGYWPSYQKERTFLQTYVAYGGRLEAADQRLVINREALTNTYAFQRRLIVEGITLENLIGSDLNAWTNRAIWHDAVTHGRVLFWHANNSNWSSWAMDLVADQGRESYLFDTIGYALYPSGLPGRPGSVLQSSNFYVITSAQASGRTHQDGACALLAQTVTPEINALNTTKSAYLGVLKSQATHSAYTADRFNTETFYMWDYEWHYPYHHADFENYRTILLEAMEQAECGKLSPSVAAAVAIGRLNEFDNAPLVE